MTRGPLIALAGLALLVVASELVRHWWYADAGNRAGSRVLVYDGPPKGSHAVTSIDLRGTRAGEILAFDRAAAARIEPRNSETWRMEVYSFAYDFGNGRQWTDLFRHSPEICYPASGAVLEKSYPEQRPVIDGTALRVRHVQFRHPLQKGPVHIFKLTWMDGMERPALREAGDDLRKVRVAVALSRNPHPASHMILATVVGVEHPAHAWHLMEREVLARCRFEAVE